MILHQNFAHFGPSYSGLAVSVTLQSYQIASMSRINVLFCFFFAGAACRALRSSASSFRGTSVRAPVAAISRRAAVLSARAMVREYPDPDYIAEVLEAFPDKAIANAEEARILFTEGRYKYLDVRPEIELDATGKVKGCVNVPIVNAKWRYDPEQKKKVVDKADNDQFVAQVKKKFPDLTTPIIVGCSDGRSYSLDALGELDDAGYECLVGLKGGFYAWYRVWDANLRRRRNGEYAETYTHDGDTCGIHASGAGFDRVDSIEKWAPPKF